MKKLYYRLKYLLTRDMVDTHLAQYDRIVALEAYVKDLKWAIDRLGYDPKFHGYPPTEQTIHGKPAATEGGMRR